MPIEPFDHPELNIWRRVGRFFVLVLPSDNAGWLHIQVNTFTRPPAAAVHNAYSHRFFITEDTFAQSMDELLSMLLLDIAPPAEWRPYPSTPSNHGK